jgi:serine/threonine-protein kinase
VPEFCDPTLTRAPDTEPLAATVARPAPAATDETLVRAGTAAPEPAPTHGPSSGSAGFAEETRQLLRTRLIVTHAAVGISTAVVTLLGVLGVPVIPCEAGLGFWATGLPLIACLLNAGGLVALLRRPGAPLRALRALEVNQFAGVALLAGAARFLVLAAPPAASPDPHYAALIYRFDAVLTNYPIVFAVILYGALIPNTRRRSLIGAGLLCLVPVVATALAAAVNPAVRPAFPTLLPVTAIPLFMAAVVAVFSASRASALQRQAFDAIREAQQLGAYVLKKKLGAGGMGEVWLAEHRLLKRPCAMKFIRAELAGEHATAARFEREVRAVTALTHFNTVRIFDYGRGDDGSFYYVMEYLDGPTLDRLVKDGGPLAPARAVHLLRQLCGALAEAHAAGMVHRDLKPNNVLVAALGGQRDVAKLLDFGLVQDASTERSDDRITRAGTVLGTPSYMCPEQAGGEAVDPRGDLYSLGAVAFFLLTGRPPFEGSTVGKLLTAHLTQPAPDVRTVRPDAPADLAAVVARCLAKDPKDRPQSAAELDAALAACAPSARDGTPVVWDTPAPASAVPETLVRG